MPNDKKNKKNCNRFYWRIGEKDVDFTETLDAAVNIVSTNLNPRKNIMSQLTLSYRLKHMPLFQWKYKKHEQNCDVYIIMCNDIINQ